MNDSIEPTKRFSARVDDYVRARPGYPAEVYAHLLMHRMIRAGDVVADIGSGTGLLAELFLKEGHRVIGVEPNDEMRAAGEKYLKRFATFDSVNGSAESTTLDDGRVDAVVAGQAFHWFVVERAAREFRRILKPGRPVTLIWNERKVCSTPFLAAYEQLLMDHAPEYEQVDHRHVDLDQICSAFSMSEICMAQFDNMQSLDIDGFIRRVRSSSYVPSASDPEHATFMKLITRLFNEHQRDGRVAFEYHTRVYYGIPGSA